MYQKGVSIFLTGFYESERYVHSKLFPNFAPMQVPTLNFRSPWFWFGLGIVVVLLRGLFLDVMDVDASQYASISMEMCQNGSWLQVQHRGADYLDKPPLLFWLSAASFSVFGISNWAYKLPSLLAALAGAWGLYRFALPIYNQRVARQAAFILLTSLGVVIICNDVRTDTLLLGATTCAIWQLSAYLKNRHWRHLAGGFLFVGLAMLAKGPIGLVVPGFAVGAHLLLSRQWRAIFKWQWLLGLAITALVLAPMCWGLWQQFDLHPEKEVNGRTGVSGLYFYFWEQSFGRVTGENVWRNDASGFYFLHVYLWAFLPWCLLLPSAFWHRLKAIVTRTSIYPEAYSMGAFTLTFIALSMSQYKLPHYIFITLPWAALLVAAHLDRFPPSRLQWVLIYSAIFAGLLLAFLIVCYVFPTAGLLLWGLLLGACGLLLFQVIKTPFSPNSEHLVWRGVVAALIIGVVVNFHFYPNLLPFQSAKPIAKYAREHHIPADKMTHLRVGSHALDFYNGNYLEAFETTDALRNYAHKTLEPIYLLKIPGR
jgi:4-amino-4-deoxy-L-arabinose transferase-like glycosyltransferase